MRTHKQIHSDYLAALLLFASLGTPLAFGDVHPRIPVNSGRVIGLEDNPDVLDRKMSLERNLKKLDDSVDKSVKLDLQPWADHLWSIGSGLTAGRYADPNFAMMATWTDRHDYVARHPVKEILAEQDSDTREKLIDDLSPAEKYDLVVGDDQGTLARAQWSVGQKYTEKGTLLDWMGICEGSAAASTFYREPRNAVQLRTAQGDNVLFHVLDIKGLASLLWSSYNTSLPVTGTRCTLASPPVDEHGVVLDEGCFNSNPGTWHIAVLNFLGKRTRPLFINRVAVSEVWNVPVLSYNMKYFNVNDGDTTDEIRKALIPLESYSDDIYRKYRAPEAVSVIGVEMEVRLAAGYTNERDSRMESQVTKAIYRYDLELDAAGTIVGGEWHSAEHPDFIWAIDPAYKPLSLGDMQLGQSVQWSGGVVPANWLDSVRLSSRVNQPLELIVRGLIELSSH